MELFLRECESPPQGDLSVPDDDGKEPDFIFETANGHRTGVEVRKLYKGGGDGSGSRLLRRDGIRRAILQRAHQLFRVEHEEPIDLFVIWTESESSPPVRETAEKLAEFVRGRVPATGVWFCPNWLDLHSAGLSKHISNARIWHAPEESFALPWHVSSIAGWSGVASDTIQAAILNKRDNLESDYTQCCDVVWLLLHVPVAFSEAYMVGDVADAVAGTTYDPCGFERVYVVVENGEQVVRLELRQPSSESARRPR